MKKVVREIPYIIGSFLIAVILIVFFQIGFGKVFFPFSKERGITKSEVLLLFQNINKMGLYIKVLKYWIVCFCSIFFLRKLPQYFWNRVYQFRYIIGIIVIVFCVCLELSGSSISWFAQFLPAMSEDTGTIFRMFNPYRSDEFGVNTIFAIAQGSNPYQNYPYFSEIVRGTRTDMFIVYGQPVWHYGILFRPFQIGYLLLGSSRGLSFFWCARLVMLFLVTVDFGMFFTEKKKKLSVCFAIMISFAPAIQWWFAINGLVEQLIFGQLCVLMLNRYMLETNHRKRTIWAAIFFWSGGCYALVFYPAWQIPFGYVFLILMIGVIVKNRKKFVWSWKRDLLPLVIVALIWSILLGGLIFKSWDTISSVLNTAYPGKRVNSQKLTCKLLFAYVYNMFLPVLDTGFDIEWVFIDFFPIGIIASLWMVFKEKQKDVYLILLNCLAGIFIIFYTLPVPEILLKITLLSSVLASRVEVTLGFLNVLILIRVCALKNGKWNLISRGLVGIVYPIAIIVIAEHNFTDITITKLMVVTIFAVFSGGMILLSFADKERLMNWAIVLCAILFLFSGGLVNPTQKGLKFLLNNKLIQDIQEIAKEDMGKWIVEGEIYPLVNIPLIAGASTINSTNVYPDIDRWKLIDSDGKNEEIYNRYAHIPMELTSDSKSSFELLHPDSFKVLLNAKDMKKLDVKYILSHNELEKYSQQGVDIQKIKSEERWYIYKVIYK